MSISKTLEKLFKKWKTLNEKVGDSFGDFDFSTVREIREEQREIEDQIYSLLLESAPPKIKKILPDDCGTMEIGLNIETQTCYFLMEDPAQKEDEELKILAITIDSDGAVNTIKDFKK